MLSNTVSANEGSRSVEHLWWPKHFHEDDLDLVLGLLFDCSGGFARRLAQAEESEEEIITSVSEGVVDAGGPLVEIYDTSSPAALEKSVNYGPRLGSTDVELIFSILEEVEDQFNMEEMPKEHILAASGRAFLLKSIVAASLNFYLACEDIVEGDELTDEKRSNFYYSLFVLLVEVILAKFPFDYWIAWRGTRYIHNQFLVRFRSILGNRGIAVIMKIIHWAVIRRNITLDFAEWSFDTVVEFVLEAGQGIYERVEDVFDEFEDDYTHDRMERYGEETRIELEQGPAEFITDDLLPPLAEHLEDVSIESYNDLVDVVEGHTDLDELKAELDLDGASQEVIETLESYTTDED